ncbi:MAG: histidine kinase [Chitinophagaceae bacterium]|jgi:flagellar basal body-associated protein FliL
MKKEIDFSIVTSFILGIAIILWFNSCQQKKNEAPVKHTASISTYNDSLIAIIENLGNTNPDSALQMAYDAEKILSTQTDVENWINTMLLIGELSERKGDFENAFKQYSKAYKITDSLSIDSLQLKVFTFYGQYYSRKGEVEKGLEYFIRSKNLIAKNDAYELANVNYNIGLSYGFLDKLDTAALLFTEGIEQAIKGKNKNSLALNYSGLFIIYSKKQEFGLAAKYGKMADSIFQQSGNNDARFSIQANMGVMAYDQKNFPKAINHFKEAIHIAKLTNNTNALPELYRNISVAYKDHNDLGTAFQYSDTGYQQFVENISLEKTKITSDAEAKFQVDVKNKDLKILAQEKKLQELKLNKQNQFIFILVLLSLLAIALSIIFFRNSELRKKRNHILEIEKENETMLRKNLEYDNQALIQENLQTKYSSLKTQVNPHFLFNSLNSLSALITSNPDRAEIFLEEMSTVYRYLLRSNEQELISLEEELSFIKSYAHLLKNRFDNGFQIQFVIEELYLHYKLPPLTLQLLLENAVKHNTLSESEPLLVIFETTKEGILIVRNNLQKKNNQLFSNKIGLKNIVSKYELLKERSVRYEETTTEFIVYIPLIK